MKEFEIGYIQDKITDSGLEQVSENLDQLKKQQIDNLLWSATGYKPDVSFTMAYNTGHLFIKYQVQEQHIRAVYREVNDPVYKDSCVEMFIAFNNSGNYYNLEFNCLGTALAGYGTNKNDRVDLPKEVVKQIESVLTLKTIGKANSMLINWELCLKIPLKLFIHDKIDTLSGQTCSVNFFKCGDDLPEPHFLSWNNIESPEPNFHKPEFFGLLKFN